MKPENDAQVFDIDFVRLQFPFFETASSKQWAFFDNAGGTFPCGAVVDRLTRFYRENKVQPYTHNAIAAAASEQMAAGRSAIAALLGAPETTLTLGPSATQNLNTLSKYHRLKEYVGRSHVRGLHERARRLRPEAAGGERWRLRGRRGVEGSTGCQGRGQGAARREASTSRAPRNGDEASLQ